MDGVDSGPFHEPLRVWDKQRFEHCGLIMTSSNRCRGLTMRSSGEHCGSRALACCVLFPSAGTGSNIYSNGSRVLYVHLLICTDAHKRMVHKITCAYTTHL